MVSNEGENKTAQKDFYYKQLDLTANNLIPTENGPNVVNRVQDESVANYQHFGKVVIKDSNDIHVGTDIKGNNITIKHVDAKNITIVQNVTPNKSTPSYLKNGKKVKEENEHLKKDQNRLPLGKIVDLNVRTKIVLCLIASGVVTISTIVSVVLINSNKQKNGGGTSSTTTVLPTTPPPDPPKDWFIKVSQWTNSSTPVCDNYKKKTKHLLAIDETDEESCNNKQFCIDELQNLAQQPTQVNNTNYNYLIGGDGRVYEGRGNNWPPDFPHDFYICIIKIAFIGNYSQDRTLTNNQKYILDRLIKKLVSKNELKEEYKMLPQCCRNIPRETGPDHSIIQYMQKKYSSHWTDNNNCNCPQGKFQISPLSTSPDIFCPDLSC